MKNRVGMNVLSDAYQVGLAIIEIKVLLQRGHKASWQDLIVHEVYEATQNFFTS